MTNIFHINEIASSAIKYCIFCKHFRHNPLNLNTTSGTCYVLKEINFVSSDKTYVDAKRARMDENLCGKNAFYFNSKEIRNP